MAVGRAIEIASIVDRLRELGAAAIAFDVVFSEPDRTSLGTAADVLIRAGATVNLPPNVLDNDEVLAASFGAGRRRRQASCSPTRTKRLRPRRRPASPLPATDPQSFLMTSAAALANISILNEAATGFGFFSFPPTPDGIVRIVPLVARSHEQTLSGALGRGAAHGAGASSFVIRATGASGEADTGQPAMTALKVGDFEVPTGPAGDFRIYFSGMPSMARISAAELLDPAKSAEYADAVAGRIVLIGTSAVGLRDFVATPLALSARRASMFTPRSSTRFLRGEFLTRPDWAPGAEIVVAILLTLILLAAVLSFGPILGAVGRAGHHRERDRHLLVRLRQRASGARSDPAEHLRAQRLHRRDRPPPAPDRPRDANSCGAPSRNISRRRWSSGWRKIRPRSRSAARRARSPSSSATSAASHRSPKKWTRRRSPAS